jgi:uncharacterized protein (TIGR02217 family)
MTFPIDAVYLNANVLAGSVWGLEDKAPIVEADNGTVSGNPRWPHRRRSWVLSWALDDTDEIETLFEVNGNSRGFRFIATHRERDYIATDQLIGTGNGSATQFQLTLTAFTQSTDSPPAVVWSAVRNIYYPLAGTVVIYLDGTPTAAFSVNTSTGIVTMNSPPSNGVEVTADFHWAWPVRFTSDKFDITVNTNHEEIHSIPIEEVFNTLS